MNINDIIALSRAGFNSEQIAQMAQLEAQQPAAQAPDPTPAPAAPTAPAAPAAPAAPTAPAAPAPDNQSSFEAIMAAIGGLKTQLQQQAIQTAQQPAQKQPTAEDMLATIINPPAAANDK